MADILEGKTMGVNEIKELIPHRYPFLLIDRLTYVDPGVKAKGYKNLTANEPFFQGHFPERPIMPGVLMIEALAQLGCVALLVKDEFKGKIGVFSGIDGFKFRSMVVPGDRLDMEVEMLRMKGPVGKMAGRGYVGDKLCFEGEITFTLITREQLR